MVYLVPMITIGNSKKDIYLRFGTELSSLGYIWIYYILTKLTIAQDILVLVK